MLRTIVRPMIAIAGPLMLGVLAGCQTQGVQWTKPGASEAEFGRDWQQCSNLAIGLNPPVFDPRTMTTTPDQHAAFQQRNSCMFSRGWQLTPKQ
jgi:hypothetical protein